MKPTHIVIRPETKKVLRTLQGAVAHGQFVSMGKLSEMAIACLLHAVKKENPDIVSKEFSDWSEKEVREVVRLFLSPELPPTSTFTN